MAEVATSVLHNVGNVLNSVNISTSLILERLAKSKISNLARLAALLREHLDDLAAFVTTDPAGRQLPAYVDRLADRLEAERGSLVQEAKQLRKNVDHIKEIVAMQQSYARMGAVVENINVTDLIEDALRMNAGALARHEVKVVREYESKNSLIHVEKHKVLQILVNLIRNAKYACDESGHDDKRLTVRLTNGDDRLRISVIDNGVGIPPENMTRIFNHGFSTRKEGHGFGLHSAALAAKEMGGSLAVHSDGPQRGAVFTLELPLEPPNNPK
jgi:signal transduction histidine kinase